MSKGTLFIISFKQYILEARYMHSIILGAKDWAVFDFVNCTQMSAHMKEAGEDEQRRRKKERKERKMERKKEYY